MFLTPALMRDVLLQLATTGIFRVKWSEDIHREWIQALMRKEPDRNRAALERTRNLMDRATPGCLVTGYTPLIPFPVLPDPNDHHVLAAAIVGRCDVIVTQNQKDFPKEALEPYGIETRCPDKFLYSWLAFNPDLFCSALREIRARLKNPPFTSEDDLATLTQQELVVTAAELEQFKDLL